MGINKIEYGGDILVDLTGDTITESDVPKGKTFHSADGEQKTGSVTEYTEDKTFTASELYRSNLVVMSNTTPILVMKYLFDKDVLVRNGVNLNLVSKLSDLGDATAEDVTEGKTFTSAAGFKEVGTHVCSGGGTSPNLQNKSVAPSESAQTVTADSGYDGLLQVDVDAIPSTYIGSNVTKKAAATYTPGKEAQTIAAGQYLEGDQTIAAVPTETKEITVNGTYTPTSGKFFSQVTVNVPSSGGGGTDNCEAYHITSASTALNFKGNGTIKVWGYGYYSQSNYSRTTYAFVGDGYYTSSYYGTPSKTSKTWSLNSDGTLSGLPTLTSCDLLVEIGV